MKKYRSRQLEIEAQQWSIENPHPKVAQNPVSSHPYWSIFDSKGDVQHLNGNQGWIETPEGGHIVDPGDYIVKGTHGEHYPVKPHIFEHKYEEVEE